MADEAGSVRDRVKLARLAGDVKCFRIADALWDECARGHIRAADTDLSLLVTQIEHSFGRLVDERDFLARAIRDLGDKEIEARVFANPDRRFTDDEMARLRVVVTGRGGMTETMLGFVEVLPEMFSDRMREIKSIQERIRSGDQSVFAEFAGHGCCDAAGFGLAIALFGGPLEMAAAGLEAIACC